MRFTPLAHGALQQQSKGQFVYILMLIHKCNCSCTGLWGGGQCQWPPAAHCLRHPAADVQGNSKAMIKDTPADSHIRTNRCHAIELFTTCCVVV